MRERAVLVRRASDELGPDEVAELRALFDAAWSETGEPFTDEDWDHATGGLHVLVTEADEIVSHASVVERWLHTGPHRLRTGYVEAVATRPDRRRRGYGARVMEDVAAHIRDVYELGALDTGLGGFYERLGWLRWEGPTAVRTADGEVRTPGEDGAVFVLFTPTSPPALDLTAPISCEWRPGDVW